MHTIAGTGTSRHGPGMGIEGGTVLLPRRSANGPGTHRGFADLASRVGEGEVEDAVILSRTLKGPRRTARLLVTTFLIGFGGWGATAPLASGAVAPGIVSPDGLRRTVQHLEGGIVREVMVRDGDSVEAGDVLAHLESVQSQSRDDTLRDRYRALLATRDRLEAERDGREAVTFAPWPEAVGRRREGTGTGAGEDARATQRALFGARLERHRTGLDLLAERVGQLEEEIIGLRAERRAVRVRLGLIEEEAEAKRPLVARGLLERPALLRLERQAAELRGEAGHLDAALARARGRIGEARLAGLEHEAARADEVARELDEVRGEIVSVRESMAASGDVLSRTRILAPVAGTVVGLRHRTPGAVIAPGEALLDLVPADEDLLVDARIALADRDVVQPGLEAQVHLTAYASRDMPRIVGTVREVSADRITDPATGGAYYLARVLVNEASLEEAGGLELVPGMPADVLIVTGERTMLAYLTEPFRRSLRRGMRDD